MGESAIGEYSEKLLAPSVLIIDEWLITPLTGVARLDVYSVLEKRDREAMPTIFCTQCQEGDWYTCVGDLKIADAICDRFLHRSYFVTLKGESMRRQSMPK